MTGPVCLDESTMPAKMMCSFSAGRLMRMCIYSRAVLALAITINGRICAVGVFGTALFGVSEVRGRSFI